MSHDDKYLELLDEPDGDEPSGVGDAEVYRYAESDGEPDYARVHAVVVEAIRQRPSWRPDDDAHEVLDRLRSVGLPIPARGETTDKYLEGLAEEC